MKKLFILVILFLFTQSGSVFGETVFTLDFTSKSNGDAFSWMKENEFEKQNDADDLICEFKDGALIIGTDKAVNGIFSKKVNFNASKVRIEWGVNKYPDGANWEKGVYREGVGVIISFGKKKIDSGKFYIPNVPYFIGLFLGEKEKENKAYTGNYYKKGGRYFCQPCGVKPNQTVVTEFDLASTFKEQFKKSKVPAISGIVIEADTRDTKGKSRAYIKKIEFLSD